MKAPGIIAVAAFLRRHDPAVAGWPVAAFLGWLRWHWRNRGVGTVGLRGRIVAVGVARCITDASRDGMRHFVHDEAGRVLWVEQLASIHPLGIPLLLAQAKKRFGPREIVSGHVFKRPGELRMLPWKRVEKLLLHHGLT